MLHRRHCSRSIDLVSYQAGYISFDADDDASDNVDTTPVESGPTSLDEIHPLASTCLDHGGLTRHDHMYLSIRINGEFATIPENTGINTGTCNQQGANMHVVHTHSSDGKLHLEMQTNEDVELGYFSTSGASTSMKQVSLTIVSMKPMP